VARLIIEIKNGSDGDLVCFQLGLVYSIFD
jgi:hypothetical protein